MLPEGSLLCPAGSAAPAAGAALTFVPPAPCTMSPHPGWLVSLWLLLGVLCSSEAGPAAPPHRTAEAAAPGGPGH